MLKGHLLHKAGRKGKVICGDRQPCATTAPTPHSNSSILPCILKHQESQIYCGHSTVLGYLHSTFQAQKPKVLAQGHQIPHPHLQLSELKTLHPHNSPKSDQPQCPTIPSNPSCPLSAAYQTLQLCHQGATMLGVKEKAACWPLPALWLLAQPFPLPFPSPPAEIKGSSIPSSPLERSQSQPRRHLRNISACETQKQTVWKQYKRLLCRCGDSC